MAEETKLQRRIGAIKHVILVLSGKGGVGKSTITSQLAVIAANLGFKVGVLDIDLCGPSIPHLFGVEEQKIHQSSDGWVPVIVGNNKRLSIMSIGFLLPDKNAPVVWRGPKKNATIKQFLEDVCWGDLDFLFVDTPPGTSDEHLSVCEMLKEVSDPTGAVIVTTPQGVALSDVSKEITFCQKLNIKVLGLIENMSGFVCPNCKECSNIFSTGGGESLAKVRNIPFIGRISIDPLFGERLQNSELSLENKFLPDSDDLIPLKTFIQNVK